MKQQIKYCIKEARKLKRRIELTRVDRKMCVMHPDWAGLTKMEQKGLHWWDIYAHKCYKNIYGEHCRQFVSDASYQTQILPRLNAVNYTDSGMFHKDTIFTDKNYQDIFVRYDVFPNIIVRNVEGEFYDKHFTHISEDEAISLCGLYPRLVFKGSLGAGHGKNVQLVDRGNYISHMAFLRRDYIIQEVMKQHESLAYYNASSVNIIRITSLLWKGKVYILGGILRVGVPGGFCDHVSGGGAVSSYYSYR